MMVLSAILSILPACTRSIVRSDRLDSRILSLDPTDSLACLDDEDAEALVPELKDRTDSLYGDKSLIVLRNYDCFEDDKVMDDIDKIILFIVGILGVLFAVYTAVYTLTWLYPSRDKLNDYRKCSWILNWMTLISRLLITLAIFWFIFTLACGNEYNISRVLWLFFAGVILVVVCFVLKERVSAKLREFSFFHGPELSVTYITVIDRVSRLQGDGAYIDLSDGGAVPFIEDRDGAFRSGLEVKAVRLHRRNRDCIDVLAGEPGRSLEECHPDDEARWYCIKPYDKDTVVNWAMLLLLAAKLERMER